MEKSKRHLVFGKKAFFFLVCLDFTHSRRRNGNENFPDDLIYETLASNLIYFYIIIVNLLTHLLLIIHF